MKKALVLGLSLVALLGGASAAYGQIYGGGGQSAQTATPEQIEECKSLGILEFTCTEQLILQKRRLIASGQEGASGSGTPMLGKGFGEMGALVGVLGAIFGGVAVAFFAMSRKRRSEAVTR